MKKTLAIILTIGLLGSFVVAYASPNEAMPVEKLYSLEIDKNAVISTTERSDVKNKAAIQEKLNRLVKEGMMTVQISTSPTFENGSASGEIKVVNSKDNKHPQVIEIILKDTQEVIYKSESIKVGDTLDSIKLDKNLSAGQYAALAQLSYVDENTDKVIGTTYVNITIMIKN